MWALTGAEVGLWTAALQSLRLRRLAFCKGTSSPKSVHYTTNKHQRSTEHLVCNVTCTCLLAHSTAMSCWKRSLMLTECVSLRWVSHRQPHAYGHGVSAEGTVLVWPDPHCQQERDVPHTRCLHGAAAAATAANQRGMLRRYFSPPLKVLLMASCPIAVQHETE